MTNRVATTIKRTNLLDAYTASMVKFLVTTEGYGQHAAESLVQSIISSRLQEPMVTSVDTVAPSVTQIRKTPLLQYLSKIQSKIVAPNGTIYTPVYEKRSMQGRMIEDMLKQRKELKKKMFAATEVGNTEEANIYKYAQTSLKINMNSLPGGYGSAYNIFYDKGAYNAITSTCRSLIANGYVTTEVMMGGNWPIFNQEDLITHLMQCITKCKPKSDIEHAMTRYRLVSITNTELFEYFEKIVKRYRPMEDLSIAKSIIAGLEPHVVQYIYYLGSLYNIFWKNKFLFKQWVKQLVSTELSSVWMDNNPKEMWDIDSDLLAVVFTVMSDKLDGLKISELTTKHPDIAKQCVDIGKRMQSRLDTLSELFNVFIYSDIKYPKILSRKDMIRSTVIISDTDSVIYTSKNWVEWYVGQTDVIEQDSYMIGALITYWLTKSVSDTLAKFSIGQGATGELVNRLQMKNEFLYPVLILFDRKKTYTGIVKVQEGVFLPNPKNDIKGAILRTSNIPPECETWNHDFIVKDVLEKSMKGKLSATELITKLVTYEFRLRNAIEAGEKDYFSRSSIQPADAYANATSSVWTYANSWNIIFGPKYGDIRLPDKVICVKINQPKGGYFDWLKEKDETVYDRMVQYVTDVGKMPSSIALSNDVAKVPEELLPLVDIRDCIFPLIKPVYATLERLRISIGFLSDKLMFSDVYPTLSDE